MRLGELALQGFLLFSELRGHAVELSTFLKAGRKILDQGRAVAALEVLHAELSFEVETPGVQVALIADTEAMLGTASDLSHLSAGRRQSLNVVGLRKRHVRLTGNICFGGGELRFFALDELINAVDRRPRHLLALGRLRGGDLLVEFVHALEGSMSQLAVDVRAA